MSPRFVKACEKNNNFSGFCSLITSVEAQVDLTLANLQSTRTLVVTINTVSRGGFRNKLAEVDGWIKTNESLIVKIHAIKEKTISAVESGKSLFDANYAQMENELKAMNEEAIRINNFRASMKRQIVFEKLEKELAKIEKKRELIELVGKKSEETFKTVLKRVPTSNTVEQILSKIDQSLKVIYKWKLEVSNISSEIYKDTITYDAAKVRVAALMAALSNEARTLSTITREGNQSLATVLGPESGVYLVPLMNLHHELNKLSASLK